MTADTKLLTIIAAITAGRTVFIGTRARLVKITPTTWQAWMDAGRPLVKVAGASLYMIERGQYVCADYCAIHA